MLTYCIGQHLLQFIENDLRLSRYLISHIDCICLDFTTSIILQRYIDFFVSINHSENVSFYLDLESFHFMGMSRKKFYSVKQKKLDRKVSDNYWSINNNIYFSIE